MVCIYCGEKTEVTNSRPQKKLNRIWRRRACTVCGAVFSSQEAADYTKSVVVRSRSGGLEPLERDKLFLSVYKACSHRKTARSDAGALCDTILAQTLKAITDSAIDAQLIGAVTLETLEHFDATAATLYRAHHT